MWPRPLILFFFLCPGVANLKSSRSVTPFRYWRFFAAIVCPLMLPDTILRYLMLSYTILRYLELYVVVGWCLIAPSWPPKAAIWSHVGSNNYPRWPRKAAKRVINSRWAPCVNFFLGRLLEPPDRPDVNQASPIFLSSLPGRPPNDPLERPEHPQNRCLLKKHFIVPFSPRSAKIFTL